MKSQQDPSDMLKQMADSMNLTVPEFEEMMREEHGLVPPDDSEDDEGDYYVPPKRKMSVVAITPDATRRDADLKRKLLLDPSLSKYEAEEIANHIAQCVSGYGEVEQRIEELSAPKEFESKAHSEAERLEYNAYIMVTQDKEMTMHQVIKRVV